MKAAGASGQTSSPQQRRRGAISFVAAFMLVFAAAPVLAVGPGDCNNDDRVGIGELVTGVGITLATLPLGRCPAIDFDLDGTATLADLMRAVGAAVEGVSVVKMRGVIEGFYGSPYSFAQRRDLLRFLPRAGLNTYLYAPKNDLLHRDRWPDPYPSDFLDHFRELAAIGNASGLRFIYSLAPGQSFDPGAGDTERVEEKLRSLFDVGVRHFCLLFDDIGAGRPAVEPDVQVDLANAVLAFLHSLDRAATLCFIGNYYSGTAEELANDSTPFEALYPISSSVYYQAYRRLDADIPILWTGPRVFSDRITLDGARRLREYVGRRVVVWDNYPANDLMLNEIFLSPYRNRDAGLEEALDGVLLNTMLQPEASKVALWTAGRLFGLGDAYDPDLALAQALDFVSGGGTEALALLAEHFRSHPLIGGEPEAPELAAAMEAFLAGDEGSRERLDALLQELLDVDARLDAELGNRALALELAEPARKLSLLADASLLAVHLLANARAGVPVFTVDLRRKIAALAEIPWLVSANTPLAPGLATFIGERPATEADVFGRFFARVLGEIEQ